MDVDSQKYHIFIEKDYNTDFNRPILPYEMEKVTSSS